MKKIILTILIIFITTIPVHACDATRTTILPGVVWCKGCCDREGYSWIEARNRQYLLHKDNTYFAGGSIMSIGFVVGSVIVIRKKKSHPKDST